MPNQYQNIQQDKRLDSIEQHISIINSEMGEVKIEIEKTRSAIIEAEGRVCTRLSKIEGKLNWYMWLTPILFAVIGFLASKVF